MFYNADTNSWERGGLYEPKGGYKELNDVVWYSNSTQIPDLDIREAFDYWSCKDKEDSSEKL